MLKAAMSRWLLTVVMSIPKMCCSTQQDSLKTLLTDQRLSFSMALPIGQYPNACQPRNRKWKLRMRMMNNPTSTVLLFFGSLMYALREFFMLQI